MWDEVIKHLPEFPSAVLTDLDAEGYPCSVRCHPEPDHAGQALRVELPGRVAVGPGPAGLLFHQHDEVLLDQKFLLVRGILGRDGEAWTFSPRRFIPLLTTGGPISIMRFALESRRNAAAYLKKRGLARPRIPWVEIETVKEQAYRT